MLGSHGLIVRASISLSAVLLGFGNYQLREGTNAHTKHNDRPTPSNHTPAQRGSALHTAVPGTSVTIIKNTGLLLRVERHTGDLRAPRLLLAW